MGFRYGKITNRKEVIRMLIDIGTLFNNVLLLMLMLIPGVIMSRLLGGDKTFASGLSKLVLYIATPAMMISPFIREFDRALLSGVIATFLIAVALMIVFFFAAFIIGGEEKVKRTLQFSIVFSNAGYMGIPLIERLLGPEATIYATVLNVSFNLLLWTLGCYIYTRDTKYMRPAKIIRNPVIIAMAIGLIIFFTPANRYVPDVAISAIDMLKGLVAPISMMVVGYHAASADYKRVLTRGGLWLATAFRLLLCPLITIALLKLLSILGIYESKTVATVIFIAAATPAATATSMFAEMFSGDTKLSGVLVPISTILSLASMPLTALLLKLY
ncbi:MAG: AEC family transporter [Clostridia bacterium]|nr:AEC family transporter [Clostridia bacterium]